MRAMNLFLRQIICYFAAVMKHPFYISLLLGCLYGLAACTGPVIIEEENISKNGDTYVKDSVPIIHEGTYSSPYSIAEAQTLGRGRSVWIEGYIVGCVKGSMKNGCNFTVNASTAANILLADTFLTGNENDYLYCIPIELPNGSLERDELNLYDHPDNFHRKVRIEGDLTLYYSVVGIKDVTDYTFGGEEDSDYEDEGEDDSEEKEPNTPNDPNDTRKDTLSIAEGIKLQSEDSYVQARIRGYIVGYCKGKKSITFPDSIDIKNDKVVSNVVIADNMDERDPNKVIVVELPKRNTTEEGYLRKEVNLYNNPQNLHKRLTVTGIMTTYYGLAGCTKTLGAENQERFLLE